MGHALYPTARYWMQTEVHVYAFSVAANVLLSFFPFLIVILSICQGLLRWHAGAQVVYMALDDFFPDQLSAFLVRNLRAAVESNGPFQIVSVILLLFTANGIFEPLEIAFNRIWGCPVNRSFLRNQLVSFGLIFACGVLAMFSTVLTALNTQMMARFVPLESGIASLSTRVLFNVAAVPLSMLMLFLIYWLLPNCDVDWRRIVPAAIWVGILLELLKYINLLTWPFWRDKLHREYGPFYYSVTTILWAFLASMLILAGAEWAARRAIASSPPPSVPPNS